MAVDANDATALPVGDIANVDLGPINNDSDGYCINVYVKPDGSFEVNKGPMPETADDNNNYDTAAIAGNESIGSYDNIGQVLRAVMELIRDNPIVETDRAMFESGLRGTKRPDVTDVMKQY